VRADQPSPDPGSPRLADLLIAEQDERRRLALFLHDGPVQTLSGIALMLDAVEHSIADGRVEEAKTILDQALLRQRECIRALRELSFSLEPVVLRDRGLGSAVSALADQMGDTHHIAFEVDVASAEQLGEKVQAALYQIVRETLNGAVRRLPPPTSISIDAARAADGRFILRIADNGAEERRRAFFETLGERARSLDATISFESNEGTTVVIEVPAAAAAE